MTDDEVRTIEQLLDKKLSQTEASVTAQISALRQRMEDGFAATATTAQIDAIAKHLAEAKTDLTELKGTLSDHSDSLNSIERKISSHLDRLDEHGRRIEKLEAKTAHLPSPPAGR